MTCQRRRTRVRAGSFINKEPVRDVRKDVLDNSTVAERRSLSASKRGCHNLRRSMQTNVLADFGRQLTCSSALNPASNTSLNLPELQNKVRGSTPPNLLYLFNSPPAPPVLKRQQQRAPTNSRRNKCEITMHRAETFIWPHQLCTELIPHPWEIHSRPTFVLPQNPTSTHSTAQQTTLENRMKGLLCTILLL